LGVSIDSYDHHGHLPGTRFPASAKEPGEAHPGQEQSHEGLDHDNQQQCCARAREMRKAEVVALLSRGCGFSIHLMRERIRCQGFSKASSTVMQRDPAKRLECVRIPPLWIFFGQLALRFEGVKLKKKK